MINAPGWIGLLDAAHKIGVSDSKMGKPMLTFVSLPSGNVVRWGPMQVAYEAGYRAGAAECTSGQKTGVSEGAP